MARGWTCERCSNKNGEGTLNCAKCGLIRGGVVVKAIPPPLDPYDPPAPIPTKTETATAIETEQATASDDSLAHPWGDSPGDGGWVAAEPAPKIPLWRRIPIGIWIYGALILIGGISALVTGAVRLPFGDIAKSGDLAANDMRVGDCWDLKDRLADSFDTVIGRPCSEAHEFEVFFVAEMPGTAYPTDDAFDSFIASSCLAPFAAYVGKEYADSTLDVSWNGPTKESWDGGDRTIGCSIEDPKNWRLIGSLKASKR